MRNTEPPCESSAKERSRRAKVQQRNRAPVQSNRAIRAKEQSRPWGRLLDACRCVRYVCRTGILSGVGDCRLGNSAVSAVYAPHLVTVNRTFHEVGRLKQPAVSVLSGLGDGFIGRRLRDRLSSFSGMYYSRPVYNPLVEKVLSF